MQFVLNVTFFFKLNTIFTVFRIPSPFITSKAIKTDKPRLLNYPTPPKPIALLILSPRWPFKPRSLFLKSQSSKPANASFTFTIKPSPIIFLIIFVISHTFPHSVDTFCYPEIGPLPQSSTDSSLVASACVTPIELPSTSNGFILSFLQGLFCTNDPPSKVLSVQPVGCMRIMTT